MKNAPSRFHKQGGGALEMRVINNTLKHGVNKLAQASNLRISDVMKDLEKNLYLLPAIQREFVWKPEKICALFDSLMLGYPIGTFLFWTIRPEHVEDYNFYAFMHSYHERDNYRCQQLKNPPEHGFQAVLDGQQRMTALYIGLRGTYAAKKPYGRWENDDSFPEMQLHIDLLHEPEIFTADETGQYAFEFKTKNDVEKAKLKGEWWFRCGRVCDHDWDIDTYLDDEFDDDFDGITLGANVSIKEMKKRAKKTLRRLDNVINRSSELTYFSEETEKLGRVLNIFIRLNSGGVPLSYSDLLLSIAIAQWKEADAREEINSLKAALFERYDFNLPKDFILKACLMLSDIGSIKFEVENFNKENSATLEREWPSCKRYLTLAVSLLRTFGYNSQNLNATNAILPVAYYLKMIGADDNYLNSTKFINDRKRLLLWFNRSILKQGIWSFGVDTFISQLRETLRKEVPLKTAPDRFPYEELEKTMLRSGRSLQFRADEIDELLELPKGKGRTFTLLSMLFPSSGLHIRDEHVDHIYPHSLFGRKKLLTNAGYTDEQINKAQWMRNLLPNLQLLPGIVNREKSDAMPLEWLEETFSEDQRRHLCQEQMLNGVTNNPEDFFNFFDCRKERLRRLIAEKLEIKLEPSAT